MYRNYIYLFTKFDDTLITGGMMLMSFSGCLSFMFFTIDFPRGFAPNLLGVTHGTLQFSLYEAMKVTTTFSCL